MTAQPRRPTRTPDKNPGREGGPIAFQHTADGIVAIGEDGFPLIDDGLELGSAAEPAVLQRYSVLDATPG
ncbi:hypothetical protein [Nocardia sp. CDC160]|uniref:hypothetical protein n=1 Tax=Nocardia sp. CDC160 TaxID=3112166 RepID=UPI002DBB775B|nr:hypothetical protein [Nocardia sp. CDC160]MEC3917700.1 hypothetical protein [Nocardia sp. CDC160]